MSDYISILIISKGYVVLNDFFTKEELEPCRKTTEDLVDDLAKRLHKAGKISGNCKIILLHYTNTNLNTHVLVSNLGIFQTFGCDPESFPFLTKMACG